MQGLPQTSSQPAEDSAEHAASVVPDNLVATMAVGAAATSLIDNAVRTRGFARAPTSVLTLRAFDFVSSFPGRQLRSGTRGVRTGSGGGNPTPIVLDRAAATPYLRGGPVGTLILECQYG
jgi:hypothetical protein